MGREDAILKITWTCSQESLAIDAPLNLKSKLEELLSFSKKSHNGYITITVETPRKPRTTGFRSQSHHLNGHIQTIAEETGMPFELLKLEAKCRAVVLGYPLLLASDGKVKVDIYGRAMGISEADSSTQECALLIEAVHMLAAELGILLQEETSWK